MGRITPRPCEITVKVVFWKEKGEYLGHCLELDIASVGRTPEEAEASMRKLILAYISYTDEHDNWEYFYRPAPPEVWQKFARASRVPRWTPPDSSAGVAWLTPKQGRVTAEFAFG